MKKRRFFKAISLLLCIAMLAVCMNPVTGYAKSYSDYSNKKYCWGLNLNKSHKKTTGPVSAATLKKYDAFYCGSPAKGDKVIYLTFDCGYENGYTSKILDTLKKYKVKAIFFVTTSYIKENPKLVKRMKKEGHLVGNHTTKHKSMPSLTVTQIKNDITSCQKAMKKYTGYSMDPFFRPPMGEFSKRTLKVTKDLGYTTILWSFAYYDYEPSDQPSSTTVVNKFKTNYHNGMLPLVHAISKANAKALPQVITYLKKKGFRFGSLYELKGQNYKKS